MKTHFPSARALPAAVEDHGIKAGPALRSALRPALENLLLPCFQEGLKLLLSLLNSATPGISLKVKVRLTRSVFANNLVKAANRGLAQCVDCKLRGRGKRSKDLPHLMRRVLPGGTESPPQVGRNVESLLCHSVSRPEQALEHRRLRPFGVPYRKVPCVPRLWQLEAGSRLPRSAESGQRAAGDHCGGTGRSRWGHFIQGGLVQNIRCSLPLLPEQ